MRYSDAGVDVNKEARVIDLLKSHFEKTYSKEVLGGIGGFSAVFKLGESVLVASTDGVGSKVLVAQEMGKYRGIGYDLIAVNVNDVICAGAKPLFFLDYLAFRRPNENIAEELAKGMVDAAKECGLSIIGGELATLPEIISGIGNKAFDLAGTCIGICSIDRLIKGNIEDGDKLVGISSNGIHCNGLTLARRVFFERMRLTPYDRIPGTNLVIGEELLRRTYMYSEEVLRLRDMGILRGAAHISGGGFLNIKRINNRFSYIIEYLPEPPQIFQAIEKFGQVPREEMFRTFNMGLGMILVVKRGEEDNVIEEISRIGKKAYVIGEVRENMKNKVAITRKATGLNKDIVL